MSLEKGTKKGKQKVNPHPEPERKSPPAPSARYDSGSHAPTLSRGTKRRSSYEQLNQIPVFTLVEEHDGQVGEWIKNTTLLDVLGGDTGSLSPLSNELMIFISKVLLSFPTKLSILWFGLYISHFCSLANCSI